MYLSKLELQGFKSFAERTVLQFDPGITAIVGPNGCGKSNVVDAVRWVVGEQRARILRSEKMENVIFNGTSKRRPLGMSEVLLTIENTRSVLPTEYTEVQLGRRLYRSGDSEYLMNGVQCRLKDITDLFMDTGMGAGAYSVIELKMIEEILSENAEDRRRLFEEAAGITKYKLRRRQTLSKLDGTQADLNRIRDLTDEVGKRVRSLKRQAEKAAKHQEYAARLRHLELALARVEYRRLTEQQQALHAEIEALQAQIEAAGTHEARDEEALEAQRQELGRREQALGEHQRTLNRHLEHVRTLETEQQLARERLEAARRDRDRTRTEQEHAEARRRALAQEAERLAAEYAAAEPALAEAEQVLAAARADRDRTREAAEAQRRLLQEHRRAEQQAEEARAGRRRDLDRLTNRLELLQQDAARTQQQAEALEGTAAELDARRRHTARTLEAAREAVADARRAVDEAEREKAERQEALDDALEARRQTERRREAIAAEAQLLDSLVSSYEEFPDTVQFLAAAPAWSAAGLQTVADVLACDEADRVALDAALGDFASCIVVQSEAEAQEAVALLRREEKGRATFLVLRRLAAPPPAPAATCTAGGLTARALLPAVRTAAPAYDGLAALLLHDAYLVETLEDARAMAAEAPREARFFARTGEWVDARGLLHGGSRQAAPSPVGGRLGRREQRDAARQTLEALEAELARHAETLRTCRADLDAVPFDDRRHDLRTAEAALAEAEKAHTRVTYEAETLERRRDELAAHRERTAEATAAGSQEQDALQAALHEAEQRFEARRAARGAAEEVFQQAEAESRAAVNRFSEANVAAVEARNRCDNLRRDRDRTRQQITDLEARSEERRAHLQALDEVIDTTRTAQDDLEARLDEVRAARAGLQEAVAAAEAAVRHAREAIAGLEAGLRERRRQREQLIREEHQRAVRLAEVQTRTEDLAAGIQDTFGVALQEAAPPAGTDEPEAASEAEGVVGPDFDEQAARAEVQELRKSLRALGGVNELALETYEEERERYEFMLTQQQDLESAEDKLLETINEINDTASRRFFETYEAIQANFTRIFSDLFGADAAASLVLVDPDDPLESAIEITARPRGKRPSTIAQLSGGEKTLTAIALLFAIYLVKPSPFCILDEVDAPLDDANVERFMRLIRVFARDTQFILVTHNKRTMEAADRLYGITMQEQGVSRLVGVQFDEAVEMVNG